MGRQALAEVREGSAGPRGGPGGVERHSRRFECGREALPKVQESLSEGWEALQDSQEGSRGPPGGL